MRDYLNFLFICVDVGFWKDDECSLIMYLVIKQIKSSLLSHGQRLIATQNLVFPMLIFLSFVVCHFDIIIWCSHYNKMVSKSGPKSMAIKFELKSQMILIFEEPRFFLQSSYAW